MIRRELLRIFPVIFALCHLSKLAFVILKVNILIILILDRGEFIEDLYKTKKIWNLFRKLKENVKFWAQNTL